MVCNSVQVITRFWAVTDMFADHLTKKKPKTVPDFTDFKKTLESIAEPKYKQTDKSGEH